MAKTTGDPLLRVARLPVGIFGHTGGAGGAKHQGWKWHRTPGDWAMLLLCPNTLPQALCECTSGCACSKLILA